MAKNFTIMIRKRTNHTIKEKKEIREFSQNNKIFDQKGISEYFSNLLGEKIARKPISNIILFSDDYFLHEKVGSKKIKKYSMKIWNKLF